MTCSTTSLHVPRNATPTNELHAPATATFSSTSARAISTTTSAAASMLAETSADTPSDSLSASVLAVSVSRDSNLALTAPATYSTVCLGGVTSAASVVSTPAVACEVSVAAGVVHSSCDNAQVAVTHELDFPSVPPTSCLMDCLGGDIDPAQLTFTPTASVPDQATFEVHESGNVLISSISMPYTANLLPAPPDTCLDTSELTQVMVKPVLRLTICPYDDEVADASLMADSMSSSRLSMVEQVVVDFTSEMNVYMVAACVVVPMAGEVLPASVSSLVVIPELVPRSDLQLKPPWPSFAWSCRDVYHLQPQPPVQGLQQGSMAIRSLNVVLNLDTRQLPRQLVLPHCRFLQGWKCQFLTVAFVERIFFPSWQLDLLILTKFHCCPDVIVSPALATPGDSMAAFVELSSWTSRQFSLLVSWVMRNSCIIFHIGSAVSIFDIVDTSSNLLGPEVCNREVSFGSLAASCLVLSSAGCLGNTLVSAACEALNNFQYWFLQVQPSFPSFLSNEFLCFRVSHLMSLCSYWYRKLNYQVLLASLRRMSSKLTCYPLIVEQFSVRAIKLLRLIGETEVLKLHSTWDPGRVECIPGWKSIPVESSESSVHTSYGNHLFLDVGLVLSCDKEIMSWFCATSTFLVLFSRPSSLGKLFNHARIWVIGVLGLHFHFTTATESWKIYVVVSWVHHRASAALWWNSSWMWFKLSMLAGDDLWLYIHHVKTRFENKCSVCSVGGDQPSPFASAKIFVGAAPYDYEQVQWKIAWSPYLGCSVPGYNSMPYGSLLCNWTIVGLPRAISSYSSQGVQMQKLLQPWDPGGIILYRLGGKPKIMGEGLSVTFLLTDGPSYLWWDPTRKAREPDHIRIREVTRKGWLGTGRRRLRPRTWRVLCSSSSPLASNPP